MASFPDWRPIRGIITPLVTPLKANDGTNNESCNKLDAIIGNISIDSKATRRLIKHVLSGGVSGIFLLGSTGEGTSLSPSLRREFVSSCCSIVKELRQSSKEGGEDTNGGDGGGVRVLVNISDTCPTESIAMAKYASDCGADAVVLAPPYYFPISQEELLNYVSYVVEQVHVACGMPVFLYNMPKLTKITFEMETLKELGHRYSCGTARSTSSKGRIVGIKDSSFDLTYMSELIKLKNECCFSWSILTGAEHQVAEVVRMGGDGGVVGGSNVFPEAFVSFYKGAAAGDKRVENAAWKKVEKLKTVYDMAGGRFVQAAKTCLNVLGICEERYALPLLPLSEEEKGMAKKVVSEIQSMS